MRGRRRSQNSRGNQLPSSSSSGKENAGDESLADKSKAAVNKSVRRGNASKSEAKVSGKQVMDARVTWNDLDSRGITCDPITNETKEVSGGSFSNTFHESREEMDDIDWEDGSTCISDPVQIHQGDDNATMTIEFSESPDSSKRRPIRRATAGEKESAELVHRVHLLCLLARGRIIDCACDDPLIQASLLSILPTYLLKISEVPKLRAKYLSSLVRWFHDNFRVTGSISKKGTFLSALAFALGSREGSLEEIAALSVALFRALKLTTRFVSILDVASIKPDSEKSEATGQDVRKMGKGIFNTSTLMVDGTEKSFESPVGKLSPSEKNNISEPSSKATCKSRNSTQSKDSSHAVKLKEGAMDSLPFKIQDTTSEACTSRGTKRKGDMEFEMQLEMALSATTVATPPSKMGPDVKDNSFNVDSPFKRIKIISNEVSHPEGMSTAIGSRKIGSPLYWAEVYCSGENLDGKWVHVDAVHASIDEEQKVEAAAASCKTSLRYVVAFAGRGAKDVTRRYCMKWYKIASHRADSVWWDSVLAPLRQLEAVETEGVVPLEKHHTDVSNKQENVEQSRVSNYSELSNSPSHVDLPGKPVSSGRNPQAATRNSLEDLELATRSLTEPLPTNQQAYKNHSLYAIERWLTKCQTLHPRGPVLGFCSGHPVYPRACVQTLKTKERWLREGMQVKAKELPAKVVEQSGKLKKVQFSEDGEANAKGIIELYGKWQLEPLVLPRAVNGIVPKNERGQVDVWSEKCLPPGTTHLRFPRIFNVAKRLEIDYAPAMVGFEFRNGRSFPVYEGIVVCSEFKDLILERIVSCFQAYAEEEDRRVAEEKRRDEAQALSRWYQLLSSIIIRQRLSNRYGDDSTLQIKDNNPSPSKERDVRGCGQEKQSLGCQKEETEDNKMYAESVGQGDDHEHVYMVEDQLFDKESSVRTKRCRCGFSIEVEEL